MKPKRERLKRCRDFEEMKPDFEDVDRGVQLFFGDALEIAPHLQADALISDPPYGMDWDTDTTRFSGGKQVVKRGKDWGEKIHGDAEPFDPTPWLGFETVVLWGWNHYAARLPIGSTLIWVKRNDAAFDTFLSDAELAWMKDGCGVYCFRAIPNFSDRGLHPTQKPVALMEWCLDMAGVEQGALVLDPYMGSCSTGIACLRTGRRFVGIEKDPHHFETALRRIRNELAQGQLFAPTPRPRPEQAALIPMEAINQRKQKP